MTNRGRQKKPAPQDWHPADVVAALRKAGWSLQQLGRYHGYRHRSALAMALHKPYPKAEGLIADALGLKPQEIWPSRYHHDGTPNRRPGPKPLRPIQLTTGKPTTPPPAGNTQTRRAA